MKKLVFALCALGLLCSPAYAGKYDLEFAATLTDSVFEDVVREAGAVVAYRGVAPAEPQGITGFDVGVEVSFVDVDADTWDLVIDAGGESAPSYLPVPRLHVRKGLPFGFDLGASYSQIPGSNIEVLGAEVQWALLDGGMATPALSFRGSYSSLQGVDDLDLTTYAADAVLSKGFLMLTPYVGVGLVQINGEYAGDNAALKLVLDDQEFTETRIFGGVQAALALLRLTVDVEYIRVPVYTAKLSLGW